MKLMKRLLAFVIIFSFTFTSIPYNVFADGHSDPGINISHVTGLKKPTARETELFKKQAKTLKWVLPNAKGLERINNARKEKGLAPLPKTFSASAGDDIISKQKYTAKEKKYGNILAASGDIYGTMPEAVDNSTDGHFPAIGDQGQLGSCTSFASTYYAATFETAVKRNINLSTNPNKILSPRFTYNLNNDGADEGTSLEGNLLTMLTRGAPFIDETSMAGYQYNGYDTNATQYLKYPSTAAIWNDALKNKLYDFGVLDDVDTSDGLLQVKEMLNNEHVLVFGTDYMYDWKFDKKVSDNPDTLVDDAYKGEYAAYGMIVDDTEDYSGHVMTIVGYNDNIWVDIDGDAQVDDFEKGAFKVANSWGTAWGNQGFLWLSYDALQSAHGHQGVISDNEAIYLVAQNEYTPLATSEITITTSKRDQLWLYAGANWNEAAEPNEQWNDYVFSGHWGGAYSFDGTSSASTATVVLDLTDYLKAFGLDKTGGVLSFCTGAGDDTSDSYSQTVSNVIFKTGTISFNALDNMTSTINNSLKWFCGKSTIQVGTAPAYDETVYDLPAIPLNTSQSVYSSGPDDAIEWSFIPTVSGKYTFSNTLNNDGNGLEIQNSARNTLYEGTDSMTVPLYAGKTYVLRTWYDDAGAGASFTTIIQLSTQWSASAYSASLNSINISTGETLTPAFNANTYNYSASIAGDSILTTVPADANAYILNGGIESSSQDYLLADNTAKTARIEVTAKDWLKTNIYQVVLTRGSPSTNADLSDISVSEGTLSPAFSASATSYNITLPYTASSITITPTKSETHAKVFINDRIQNSLALSFNYGESKDTVIKVLAQDLKTSKTYTIHISRQVANNAKLASINTTAGLFFPQISASVTAYNIFLNPNEAGTTLTAVPEDPLATVKIDGVSTTQTSVTLQSGETRTVTIAVTSLDGTVTKNYTVSIFRQKAGAPITIDADFLTPSSIVSSPNQTKLYMVSSSKAYVYEIDLQAGTIHALSLPYQAQRLYYSEGKILVSLVKPESAKDTIGIIDPNTFTLTNMLDVDMDFWGITADANYFYAYSYNKIAIYDRVTQQKLSSYTCSSTIYDVQINPATHMLYAGLSNALTSYTVANGILTLSKQSSYSGSNLTITPDGQHLIRNDGLMFSCSPNVNEDMIYLGNLTGNKAFCFDTENNEMYYTCDKLIEVRNANDLSPKRIIQDSALNNYLFFADNYFIVGQKNSSNDITFRAIDPRTLAGKIQINGEPIENLYPLQDTIDCGSLPLSMASAEISAIPMKTGSIFSGDTGVQQLAVGQNSFSINVTDPASGRSKTYTLHLTRLSSDPVPITADARVKLPFAPLDEAMDPSKPVIYMTTTDGYSLYAVNYDTGEIKEKKFSLKAERIDVNNGKIYLTLLRNTHSYYLGSNGSGAIAIINPDTLKTEDIFDIAVDPFDIKADGEGRVYIAPGSDQDSVVSEYDSINHTHVADVPQCYQSYMDFNTAFNKVYLIRTTVTPRSFDVVEMLNSVMTKTRNYPYVNLSPTSDIRVSPDGSCVFNGSGCIYACTPTSTGDMAYLGSIKTFSGLCFDLQHDRFYTSNNKTLTAYDYSSKTAQYTLTTNDYFINLQNKGDKIIALKVSNGSYYIKEYAMDSYLGSVSVGGKTVTGFDANVQDYNITVATNEDSILILPSAFDSNGQISGDMGLQPINLGDNTYTITVTGAVSGQARTYTLHVTRILQGNAYLSAINTNAGSLTPDFDRNMLNYTLSLSETTGSVTITPVKEDNLATMKINGSSVTSTIVTLANGASTDVTIDVTASEGITINSYKVHVTRAASTNANLSSIAVSAGTLTPSFDKNTLNYTLALNEATNNVNITVTKENSLATTKINGSSSSSIGIGISNGASTDVVIDVTAGDGITKKTYTIHLTRAISTDANLSSLSTSTGSMTPVFNTSTVDYSVSIPNPTSSTTISATKSSSLATLRFDGTVASSKVVSLASGESKDVIIQVTAQDGITVKTYTVHVSRQISSNANLSNITLSYGVLSPTFNANTTEYTGTIPNTITSMTVYANKADSTATLKIDGSAVTSKLITLGTGASQDVVIQVTAQDTTTQKQYTVHVQRDKSTNANLSGINLTSGTLAPAFNVNTLAYSVTLSNTTPSTTLTPAKADTTATIKIDGTASTSKTVTLGTGESQDVSIEVTAQDGVTVKTYAVHISRAVSSNANLSNVTLSDGALAPTFNANTLSYSVTLSNVTPSTIITPVKADSTATVKIDGIAATSESVMLDMGASQDVNIAVTAQDGVTKKQYTVHVQRNKSTNANLSNISSTAGTLTPAFSPSTYSYTLTLPETIESTTIIPDITDNTETFKIDGVSTSSKTITLSTGGSQGVFIEVTAQDGATKKQYTINVQRNKSTNANLSIITLTDGTLSPVFDANTQEYNFILSNITSSTFIHATSEDSRATFTIDGEGYTGRTVAVSLGGTKDVVLKVTAQDGITVKTYTVHIARPASTNASLSSIAMSNGALSPEFSSNTTEYSLSLPNTISSTIITAATADITATLRIDGVLTSSKTVSLATGEIKDVTIQVTAQDGITVKTYTVHISRAASSNADLFGINKIGGTLSPAFDANITEYTITLPNASSSVTLMPITADNSAVMLIDDALVVSKTVDLSAGETKSVIIKIIAQDGITIKTYTVHIIRVEKQVSGVSLSQNTLTFTKGETGTLSATVSPQDATNKGISWSSSNTSIATVTGGTINAVSPGSADITVTTQDGGYHDTCRVTVMPRRYTITAVPNNTSYGTTTGGGVCDEGSQVTLRAAPKPGYRFVRWIQNGMEIATNTEYVLTVTADTNLTAEFATIGIPANVSAVPTAYDCITVKWDRVDFAAGYEVWRSTSYNGNYTKVLSTSATTFTDTKLTTNTTYYYKVNAYCISGSTTTSGSQSVYVFAIPVLQTPSISANSTGYDSAFISWNLIPGANGYQVYRSVSGNGAYTFITTTTSTSYTNTKLNTGTTYYYEVCAYRNTGSAKMTGSLSASSSAIPYLDAVMGTSAVMSSVTSVRVAWNAVNGRSGYEIWRSTAADTGYVLVKSTTSTYLNDTNLAPNITYYYKIRAYRTVNGVKVYGAFSGTANAMPVFNAVTGTTAGMYSATSIKISWTAVDGRKSYEIWRSTSPDSGFILVKPTTATSIIDKNLVTNTTYYYKVRAYCVANGIRYYSADSNTANVTPTLAAVTGATASKYSATKIKLAWSSVLEKTGYEIWRSTSASGDFTLIMSQTSTSYYDINVMAGTTYYYKIRAYRVINNMRIYGEYSPIISVVF